MWQAATNISVVKHEQTEPTQIKPAKMGSTQPPTKRIVLNFFEYACTGSHMSPGQWRDPSDQSHTKDRLTYWTNLAKLAERGKISYIFFADSYGGQEVFAGNSDAQLKAGNQTASMDPMVLIPAMAAVTKTLGFGVSASTSYLNPYMLARTFSSLDHLTEGRVAWNIVTSWAKSAALSLGFEDGVPHDERYAMADEYMDLCYKFWESSWADDAVVWDREKRVAFDPEKVRYLEQNGMSRWLVLLSELRALADRSMIGKYFKMKGRYQTHPSPQRTPVLFQAGTSKSGRAFASKHAEGEISSKAMCRTLRLTRYNQQSTSAACTQHNPQTTSDRSEQMQQHAAAIQNRSSSSSESPPSSVRHWKKRKQSTSAQRRTRT